MDEGIKEKIHASMKNWAILNGWPDNLSNDQIIHRLPEIWRKLESEGLLEELIKKGLTYKTFANIAIQKKREADMMKIFGDKMRGFGFWK